MDIFKIQKNGFQDIIHSKKKIWAQKISFKKYVMSQNLLVEKILKIM